MKILITFLILLVTLFGYGLFSRASSSPTAALKNTPATRTPANASANTTLTQPQSDLAHLQATQANRQAAPLPPEIKAAVNHALRPEGITYPVIQTANGIIIDTSKRAVSVSTAVIDDKGELHVTDYTHPVK